ncbi:MAG TPA: CHAT domain-containing tetratricopeptide repeat protein [Candidatus Sulfomarinibacteraceae bacterium]|nr:CHAT domain-containing tetratricopeptide repeat protein [Candidatus Sulfomarinibacteraceae bacterium]
MNIEDVLAQLWALPDSVSRRRFLDETAAARTPARLQELGVALKASADQFLHSNIERCLEAAALLQHLAQTSGYVSLRALGLLAEANARAIGLSEYRQAITLYNEAGDIYEANGQDEEWARAQIGKLWPLATLGRYDEALKTGRRAAVKLRAAEAWLPLAKLTSNIAIIYGRMGQDREALANFEDARDSYRQLGEKGRPYLARVELNRAIILRNLGRFQGSIAASEAALGYLPEGAEQRIDRARAKQSLAITYFVLGKYNEALQLLDEVRDVFLDDGRQRDAILVELFISDCLLQLRRFRAVLEKCAQVRALFQDLGTRFEVAQAVLNEAVAYAGLEQYEAADSSLQEARDLFRQENNEVWLAFADLEWASLLLHQGQLEESGAIARRCAAIFGDQQQVVPQAQAWLVAARAAAGQNRVARARELLREALAVGEEHSLPTLVYQARHLLGGLARDARNGSQALQQFDAAIEALEQLRGRLMVEYRADFLEDKNVLYEDAVSLCAELQRPQLGLEYAERAKSRALLDLLAYRLDVGLQARREEDHPLVAELTALRAERDRLYRRWQSGEGHTERGWATADDGWQEAQQDVLRIENRITELWHRLLIHNADYARDAALWQVRTEPVQPYLDDDTLLLEYFVARGQLLLFLVTAESIEVQPLAAPMARVQQLSQLLWLNLRSVPRSDASQEAHLTKNARAILQRLYDLLLRPLLPRLEQWPKVIVVPHGPLHYLPFHALHDGRRYLLQDHEVSYLPGASFLRYCHQATLGHDAGPVGTDVVAVGHSLGGSLPYTVDEARAVASLWQGQVLVEEEATRQEVGRMAALARLLHVAAHGDFRPDNPLFSGLSLDDGWLTTLDIFNLRLQASLVTLSACQTGRNVVAGGDELLGLMRAFLYAGAASLVLSFWAVEDRSTARLMETFYNRLARGESKGAALRAAQRHFISDGHSAGEEPHPYYWAPFFLVGATTAL